MSILGNAVTLGGGGGAPYVVLTVAGRHADSTLGGVYTGFEAFEDTYFRRMAADSTYTCLKAGTYKVAYFYKAGYNTSGNLINVQLVIQVNGSNVVSATSTEAIGGNGTRNITLNAGDTLAIKMRNTTSSGLSHAGGMVVTTI